MMIANEQNACHATTRKAWRAWLSKNHLKKDSIWLIIYHKKSGKSEVDYGAAVEEALCFGWIDSRPNKRDNESYYLFFSKRNPKSKWSDANRKRVKKLMKEGLMQPQGIAMVELAKKKGTWNALAPVHKMIIPKDLQNAFTKNKTAWKNFEAFPPSAKRAILEWILNAKRPETRQTRINETVSLAKKNIRANQYQPRQATL